MWLIKSTRNIELHGNLTKLEIGFLLNLAN